MVFYPPPWVPKLPFGKWHSCATQFTVPIPTTDPPDSVTIGDFMKSEICGRRPVAKSRNPFTCGLTGKTYTVAESHQRTDLIARALSKVMGWEPNADSPWDKVVAVFSFNTVCDPFATVKLGNDGILTLIHRLTTSRYCTPRIACPVLLHPPTSHTLQAN